MSVTNFRLPTAWRSAEVETVEVPYDESQDVLAAHHRVLSVVTDDSAGEQALFTTGSIDERYALCVAARNGVLTLHGFGAARLAELYRAALADGDYLPAAERESVLSRWSVGPSAERGPETVIDLFQAQVARTPDAIAVRVDGESISYRELDHRSNQFAWRLNGLGVTTESPVGVCLRRSADLLPVILGIWKAGGAYLPLDPELPPQRLHRMIEAADAALVVTRSEHLGVVGSAKLLLLDEEQPMADGPIDVSVGARQLAYVIYTSGSTGTPKGVMVEHGNLVNYLLWTVDEYAARGTGGSAFFTSITFDLGIPSLLTPLLVGQTVDLLPDPLDTADLGALLVAGAPYSFLKMTPGHLNLLTLDLGADEARGVAGLVIAAGDAFPTELARRWTELAGTPVATEYGPTEITVGNSGQVITDDRGDGLIPLGQAIPNTSMYVLTEDLEPAPVGVPGEVHIGGLGVSRGYLGDPALTATRFVPDPYGPPGARLYRTGDRARWQPTGDLEFLGRGDGQVKIRGYRVELGEIQETLRRRPEVEDAVVIAVEQPRRPPRLTAFVRGSVSAPERLRADLAAELPAHMVPAEIVLVDGFPLTANGKVDTRALVESSGEKR
ncbi:amino acid adenylation domain-containing protein [Kutzneria chonburiensis]|uniref:Amino acid adenylation domain-containing protein n=1 Tax=Kutzneria chonburiensis TaxID=1483604 RepID=A0ABV6MN58_9PSEU|nr:amino acid adenylation domain-containing protein [Kutzneria chonburiensis]